MIVPVTEPPPQPGPPSTQLATLEVQVTNPIYKEPAKGATVRLSTGPTQAPDQVTDANGITRFEIAPGEYHINAAHKSQVWQPAKVKQGTLVACQV